MKNEIAIGDPGLFRKDLLIKIKNFQDEIKNSSDFQGVCHAKSIDDLSCNDDSLTSPLDMFE